MTSLPYKVSYPVLVRKVAGDRFIATPYDFSDCIIEGISFNDVVEQVRIELESIIWNMSYSSKSIPEPSEPGILEDRSTLSDVVVLIDVAKRYSDFPKTLYLYYPFEANLLEMLHQPYIWFSDPKTFNDPFELPNVISDEWTNPEKWKDLEYAFSLARKGGGWAEEFDTPQEAFAYYQLNDPELIQEISDQKAEALNATFEAMTVSCFSRNFDSVLMWSHYAKKHTGVVIGYDYPLMIQGGLGGSDVDYRWHKSKLRAGGFSGEITFKNPSDKEYMTRKLLTKHPMWDYEQEFRFIRLCEGGKHQIPLESITELHFGCQMEISVKQTLIDSMISRNIDLYDMRIDDTYGLKRHALSID